MPDIDTIITFSKWDPTNIHAHLTKCSEAQRDEIDQHITKYLVDQSLIVPRPPDETGNPTNDIEHLIDFIYQGEVNISTDSIFRFISLAEEFKLKGLTNKINIFLLRIYFRWI